jgi:DGQHR domain-containing protein
MLTNVLPSSDLTGLARSLARSYVTKTVHPALVETELAAGWTVLKKNKKSVQLSKPKTHGAAFQDRVWVLLYRMGFEYMSGQDGARLALNPKDKESPINKLDAVAIDAEVGIAVECKSQENYGKRGSFQEELHKHASIRQRFAHAVNSQFPVANRRQVGLAMFLSNVQLGANDLERCKVENVMVFDERDLTYYEGLVDHLGEAAKYQFLADLLPGKQVPGLTLRVPAIKSKMGGVNCYTFSVSPAYLLKIAFVSHRARGKGSDIIAYQRLIKKSRLKKLQEYIDEDGIFPTNIVLNLDKEPRFDQVEGDELGMSGKMGWLELRPSYRSAWVIDGQHRLFAYSGHQRATTSRLSVLAFEKLSDVKQAELFIDINAQQKSVKRSLLDELYADLHMEAEEPENRIRAIVSKAMQNIDSNRGAPFFGRILLSDSEKTATRCISLTSLVQALAKAELYAFRPRRGASLEYGPLWGGDSIEATRSRTEIVIESWFSAIRAAVPDWWEVGAGDGGGIAMNDGVAACIAVLRSVFQHLEDNGERLERLDNDELIERLQPYASALAKHLSGLSIEERKRFRDLRGVQGVTMRIRRCQQGMKEIIPSFNPQGLADFMEQEKAQTNLRAKLIADNIEKMLQRSILEDLRREFGLDESQWWIQGVPKNVRKRATDRYEEDDAKRGGKEFYIDLIDYRAIIAQHWTLFGGIFGYGSAKMAKDKRTQWISDVNDIRRIVAHASSGRTVTLEQLAELEGYEQWLTAQLSSIKSGTAGEASDEAETE